MELSEVESVNQASLTSAALGSPTTGKDVPRSARHILTPKSLLL